MFAYDLGFAIDLDRAEGILSREGASREALKHAQRAPRYVEYQPAPLRVARTTQALTIAGISTGTGVEAVMYDFGVVCLTYRLPLSGPLEALLPLSHALYENESLLEDSKRVAAELLALIRPAVDRGSLAGLVEDYFVYQIESWEGAPTPQALVDSHRATVANVLRAETAAMSEEEVQEALAVRLSYGVGDTAVVDWNAAIVLGPDQDDAVDILEFANVELLEMRFLDDQLDRALARAYEAVQRRSRLRSLLSHQTAADLRRIASFQVDSAVLFEGVNNALKLVGDQYLARLYRKAGERLHLPAWDTSILRKLGTLETIYDKIADRQSARRMEVLEWIIILLIAFEVVMSFIRAKG